MVTKPKERLLLNALELFSLRGFHATGIDTILAQSKVAKTTLYRHFRSKEELIIAVLRKRDEDFRNWLMRSIDRTGTQGAEKLLAVFDVHRQWAEDADFNGCLFVKAAHEFPDADSPINTLCVEHKRLVTRYLKGLAEFSETIDPQEIAAQMMVLIDGATVSAQMTGNSLVFERAKASARKLLIQ